MLAGKISCVVLLETTQCTVHFCCLCLYFFMFEMKAVILNDTELLPFSK